MRNFNIQPTQVPFIFSVIPHLSSHPSLSKSAKWNFLVLKKTAHLCYARSLAECPRAVHVIISVFFHKVEKSLSHLAGHLEGLNFLLGKPDPVKVQIWYSYWNSDAHKNFARLSCPGAWDMFWSGIKTSGAWRQEVSFLHRCFSFPWTSGGKPERNVFTCL